MRPCRILLATLATTLLSAAPDLIAADVPTGRVEGTITYRGEVPKNPIRDDTGRQFDLFTVNPKNHGLSEAVVYLVPLSPDVAQLTFGPVDTPAVIDQIDHTFVPHVVSVRAGQPVRFKNSDPANHNVRAASLDERNQFNVYTGTGAEHTHRFHADPKYRPVKLGCDIHAWMGAWIYVFPHPWHTTTDTDGKYRIDNVPPGKYRLEARQPDGGLKETREIVVDAKKPVREMFQFAGRTAE